MIFAMQKTESWNLIMKQSHRVFPAIILPLSLLAVDTLSMTKLAKIIAQNRENLTQKTQNLEKI